MDRWQQDNAGRPAESLRPCCPGYHPSECICENRKKCEGMTIHAKAVLYGDTAYLPPIGETHANQQTRGRPAQNVDAQQSIINTPLKTCHYTHEGIGILKFIKLIWHGPFRSCARTGAVCSRPKESLSQSGVSAMAMLTDKKTKEDFKIQCSHGLRDDWLVQRCKRIPAIAAQHWLILTNGKQAPRDEIHTIFPSTYLQTSRLVPTSTGSQLRSCMRLY